MALEFITLVDFKARPLLLTLPRPVVARIATIAQWPVVLMDLYTEEGVAGCGHRAVDASVSGSWRTRSSRDRVGPRARVAVLGRAHLAASLRGPGQSEVRNSMVHIPDRPGLGLDWDEAAVARHLAA